MHIFYLTVDRYRDYRIDIRPGETNPGGGISTKTQVVLEAWRRFYDVGCGQTIEDSKDADILVVEPLWFLLRGGLCTEIEAPDLEASIQAYEQHPARLKILYLSELSFARIKRSDRDRIAAASTVITSNCEFQRGFFDVLGYRTQRLCDPVSSVYDQPDDSQRELSVMAVGRVSQVKNTPKLVHIFDELNYLGVKTIFVGNATLWGDAWYNDKSIERDMQSVASVYYPSLTPPELAELWSRASCGIFDSFHDSCCASNLESLMAGVLCLYGLHGAWADRPGIHGLDSIEDFVDALSAATENFTRLPDSDYFDEARRYAMENYSPEAFLKNWSDILRGHYDRQ